MIITEADINFLDFIGEQESQEIRTPLDFAGAVTTIAEGGGQQSGENLPWGKTGDTQKLRMGELSIWGGINGHGKSLMVGFVILHVLKKQKALVASLEMKPPETLYRMACQYTGCRPNPPRVLDVMGALESRLWIYDQLDTVATKKILGVVHYAAKVLEVNHIVIDSLMKCGVGRDYEKQADFVNSLQWAAKSLNIHIHLVCHMRKGENEEARPGKFDIRGAAEIVDVADNLFIVSRNKRKERLKRESERGKDVPEADLQGPDCYLEIGKNRHGSKEDVFGLYYHEDSMQYLGEPYSSLKGAMAAPF